MMDSILKDRLLGGLQDAVSNYNLGMDEEMAIAKSASDHGFNKAQTERLVELYNTSRTLYHFEHNKNEKSASFHLADKDAVLGLLFDTTNEKMASEFDSPAFPSAGYDEPETDFYLCKSAEEFPFEPEFEKTANDIPNLDSNSWRMGIQISKMRKEAEHLGNDARMENEMSHMALIKLASRLSAMFDGGDMQKIATVIGVLAEPENADVFERLSHYLPKHVMECNIKRANVVDDFSVREEVALAKEAAAHVERAEELLSEAEAKLEECKKAAAEFDKLLLDHFGNGESINEMDKFVSGDGHFDGGTKQAEVGAAFLGSALGNLPWYISEIRRTPVGVEKEVEDSNKRLTNLHRGMLLADLVNNDPYLSEEDPKVIAGYYSHFAELSPELANNKEVVRSVLRQAVHNGGGGFSPFDAGSFMDAEKTLKEIRGTLPPKKMSKSDIFEDKKEGKK